MVLPSIQIVPTSGFEFDTGYPGGILVYPKSVQARAEIATQVGHDNFFLNPFPISYPTVLHVTSLCSANT